MIQTLLSNVGEFKKDSILAPLCVSMEVVLEVLVPLMMAHLLDYGIEAGDMNVILRTGGVLVVACMCSLFFGVQSGKYAARASAGFAKNLRRRMFYNVQEFSFSNIDKFSTASLVTRLTTDISNIQNAYPDCGARAAYAGFLSVYDVYNPCPPGAGVFGGDAAFGGGALFYHDPCSPGV